MNLKRPSGFSLIELVVTLMIAGIVMAVAIPMFNDPQINESWFQEQVRAALRYAQRQAVAQRRCIFVEVTAAQVKLRYGDAACAAAGSPLTFLATVQAGKAPGDAYVLEAPSGTALSPAPTTFSFNGLGQPSFGSTLTLSVGARAVTIAAETGYVQ